MGYTTFLIIELAKELGIIHYALPYDMMWGKGMVLENTFLASEFNVDSRSEYDCMLDFLKDYKLNLEQ